jgi:hypothetical protein
MCYNAYIAIYMTVKKDSGFRGVRFSLFMTIVCCKNDGRALSSTLYP